MEIMPFSMILGFGQEPPSHPTSGKNYGNHIVFNDGGRMGSCHYQLPPLPKTIEIIMRSMTFRLGQGPPVTPTSPKNYENRNVFNDFGGWAGAPIISHLLQKLGKSECFQ